MKMFAEIILALVSILLIFIVLVQPSKNNSTGILGVVDQSFGKAKARGIDVLFLRITIFLSVAFGFMTILVSLVLR